MMQPTSYLLGSATEEYKREQRFLTLAVTDNAKQLWKALILERARVFGDLHTILKLHEVFPKVHLPMESHMTKYSNGILENFNELLKKYLSRKGPGTDSNLIRKYLTQMIEIVKNLVNKNLYGATKDPKDKAQGPQGQITNEF